VAETLIANQSVITAQNAYVLNQRFSWTVHETRFFPLNYMIRTEWQVVDSKSNDALAHYVNFSASHERRQAGWSGWKFWLDNPYCFGGEKNSGKFTTYMEFATNIASMGASIQAALIASGFSINQNNPTQSIQATAFITQWRVIDQYTAPFSAGLFGTGFSGTLQRKVPESISFQP
jgi:hypothetical protein